MTEEESVNNKKLFNLICDLIMLGVVVLVVIAIGSTIHTRQAEKKKGHVEVSSETGAPATTTEPEESEEPQASIAPEEGYTTYKTVVNSSQADNTIFYLRLNDTDGTYRAGMIAGADDTLLDKGTYERDQEHIAVTSGSSTADTTNYLVDGDYLVNADEIYSGQLPEGDVFEFTTKCKLSGTKRNKLIFKKDGTYEQQAVTKSTDKGGEDKVDVTTGTYHKAGDFLVRATDEGQQLADMYIYQNQLVNSFFKIVK